MINRFALHPGDCLETLKFFEDNSIDSIVTDPPYGLSFMGKRWDYDVPTAEVWAECLRVLKPGGHLLAFAGTRTQHRMAVRIEDAGFEIRDMIAWVYGSGFPKSRNGDWGGTALKPALEPITVARKPLIGTVATNWAEHGTGAFNIDGCRVATIEDTARVSNGAIRGGNFGNGGSAKGPVGGGHDLGRWPANLIHDGSEEVVQLFPRAPGQKADLSTTAPSAKLSTVYAGGPMARVGESSQEVRYAGAGGTSFAMLPGARRLDTGSAARFFYCAKASRADRNEGLTSSSTPAVTTDATMRDCETADWSTRNGNHHPTVKPTDLMAYLVRLVTPAGGIVLDPFMGSGSTGKAAMREGMRFIGCELDPAYLAIAQARIEHELAAVEAARLAAEVAAAPVPQLDLFA